MVQSTRRSRLEKADENKDENSEYKGMVDEDAWSGFNSLAEVQNGL